MATKAEILLDKAIKRLQEEKAKQRQKVIDSVTKLVSEYNNNSETKIGLSDLYDAGIPDLSYNPKNKRVMPVLYRNPKQPQSETYTGMGPIPVWMAKVVFHNVKGMNKYCVDDIRNLISSKYGQYGFTEIEHETVWEYINNELFLGINKEAA